MAISLRNQRLFSKAEASLWPHSIRWRLQIWLAFLLVSVLGGFGFTTYQLERGHRLWESDRRREGRLAAVRESPFTFGSEHQRPPSGQTSADRSAEERRMSPPARAQKA